MKILGRLFSLVAAAMCFFAACERPQVEEPVKIRLNKELISGLSVGATQQLEVSVTPADAKVTLVWASDNESVAVVDDQGNVTGVTPGTAEVSVTADEAVAKCKVNVIALKPQGLSLDVETLEMTVGQTRQLEAEVTPEGAQADDLQWSSSKESVAAVKDGNVTAVSEGKAIITVSCNGGKLIAECEVTVAKQPEEKVMVSSITMPSELELTVGASSVLDVTVLPENAIDKTVTFSVDGDCVSVDQTGKVLAVKEGTAVVTATANDGSGVTAECNVTVVALPSDDDEVLKSVVIKAADNASDVQVGKELQLIIECDPVDVEPKTVSWTIDNPSLAQVTHEGVVIGKEAQKGSDKSWSKVVVTVNADGLEASLSLRVIPRQPESIEVDLPENNQIKIGSGWGFEPKVYPEGLGFGVLAISDPYGNISDGFYTNPSAPGRYSYIFTLADHENLVNEYKLTRSVSLDVIPYWVETISLPESLSMEAGSSLTLTPAFTSDVEGHQPTYKDVVWSSSDKTVATVNERTGEISALKAGTVEITVTTCHSWSVPSGESHKSATCVVTIDEPAVALNIGDYYYSDGTWSSELDPSKKVIGIVFSKANAAASDSHLASDYPGCTHGLVLSTEELLTSCTEGRSWSWENLGNWCYGNGYGQFYDLDKPVGYSNTLGFEAANAAAIQSFGYTIDFTMFNSTSQLMSHRDAVAVPSTASRWYIPSYKEMVMLYENVGLVNERLEAVGGDVLSVTRAFYDDISYQYWCSTYDLSNKVIRAFSMLNGEWYGSKTEGTKLGCRVVLAF